MPVDLTALVPVLKRELSPPGTNLYPDATDVELKGYLQDGFWEARLNGALAGYTEDGGVITPVSGTTDMPRELQQLIVLFSAFRIVLATLRDLKTVVRREAGPVSEEIQQSANVARDVLAAVKDRIKTTVDKMATTDNSVVVLDAIVSRTIATYEGDTWFVR